MIENQEKPLITFALFSYNQEQWIGEAIVGAFAQDYSPLQIIISDDCSSDGTWDIIERMAADYVGPHSIKINRNINNLGLTSHVNEIFSMASGELIVVAAGDDISVPKRTSSLVTAWILKGCPSGAIHSAALTMSTDPESNGKLLKGRGANLSDVNLEWFLSSTLQTPIHGATAAYTKDIYSYFGPISAGSMIEDLVLVFRAILIGKIIYVNEVLINYRVTEGSLSARIGILEPLRWISWMSSANIRVANHISDYLIWCKKNESEPDCCVLRKLKMIAWRFEYSKKLVSKNAMSKLIAALLYPGTTGWRNRTYFISRFYGWHELKIYRLMRGLFSYKRLRDRSN